MPTVIGIIQARMGSSRLPGKILAPLAGRCLLDLLATRLRDTPVEEWWLATTEKPEDDVTEAWGHSLGLRVYRGDSENVLSRFTAIIREREPEWIVRVTADDPFTDAGAITRLIECRDEMGKGRALLALPSGGTSDEHAGSLAPLGFGAQLARADDVVRIESEIPDGQPYHRTHVLSWLEQSGQGLSIPLPEDWPHRPDWRWTVDTPEDLSMARSAFHLFGLAAATITYPEMVAALDLHPEIVNMNAHVQQKSVEQA